MRRGYSASLNRDKLLVMLVFKKRLSIKKASAMWCLANSI